MLVNHMMYQGLLLILILSYLDLSQSTCPVFCDTTSITFECHVTTNTSELEDNWIQSCYYPSSGVQFLRIIVTNYSYPSLSINLPSNLTSLRNIMINFYQIQSLTLNSTSDNSNITSLTLSGGNSFTNGITDLLSKFPHLISLYLMNNTQLEYLEDGSFVSLTELELLTVERVGIERIGENLFVGLSLLSRLEWTSSVTSSLTSSTFSHLPSLQYLNLMDNRINYIPDNIFSRHLPNLKCITLVRNELTTVPYQAFEQCPALSNLRLEHNPLICNCSLYWMHFALQRGFIANITISCANDQIISNLTTPQNSSTTALNRSEIVTACNDTDMYECLSPYQPCEHLCTNSLTGFSCSCDDGYILESDRYTCTLNISCPVDHSYCPDSSCCIPALYSCPLNLTETLEGEMDVTIVQVSPLLEVVNRSILLYSVDDLISLNISLFVSSQVLVQSCEIDWQQCFVTVLNLTMTESFTVQFSLPSTDTSSNSPLHYLLLSVTEIESRAVQLYERLLVVIQNSLMPTLYTRSLVRRAVSATSSDVLIGAAVSSLEASLCSQVCPHVNVSLFSVGLIDVDISDWEGVSVRLVGCTSLPSQYWMSYNSYVFSIEWDNVSSELNGKYELRMNVNGLSSGVSELSIDYPVAENVCKGRLDIGVYWNWTINGTSNVIPCSQLFGPPTGDIQYSDQFMERSCDSNLEWSSITIECSFPGNITQILSFTAIFTPSQLMFAPLYYPTVEYTDVCIDYTLDILLGFGVPLLSTQQSNNIITFWFDASGVNIEQINSFLSNQLSTDLSACLTEYSFHFVTQSTICDCVNSPDVTLELQHTRLCTTPACSCTNTSCSCNSVVYGDGTNCSLDTDGDGLPDNQVLCGSSLCVDTCPYQSRCVSPSAEISEGCEAVCPHETDPLFSLTWPCTAGGVNREVMCPTGGSVAVRKCHRDGTWEDPSTLDCVSDSYANLGLNINDLLITILGIPPIVFGDLVVSLNILEENSRNLHLESTQYGHSVLNTASQVVSNLVTDSSINLLRALEKEVSVAELLLDSIDRFVDNLAVRNCSAVILQYDRVCFKVIELTDPSNHLSISADNIHIGENGMSPSVDILQSTEFECTTYVVIENLASLVTDTSSLRFGSSGLDGSVFEEILISPTLQSVNLYKNNQAVSEKGGNPLIRLHFPINTADLDLGSHRLEVAVGYLTSQSGMGRWEGDGISVVSGSVTSTISVEVTHLTSFAAILGITAISPTSSVLPLITYFGSTIAIICLALSLTLYVIFGFVLLKKIYHFIHFNTIISLLLCYVVFMLGIELAYADFLLFIPCKIVSYIFTYLLLVTFLWMFMETIVILIMARWPYYRFNIKYNILFFCVSWIGPLVYTLVTLSWFHSYLISPPFDHTMPLTQPVSGTCWIDTNLSTNFTITILAIPTILITISILSLVIAVCVILKFVNKDEPELPRSTKASIRLLITISTLYPLIVIGWLFGLLALSLQINVLFWFFALFASAQGVVNLILITIRASIYNSMLKQVKRVSKWLHLQRTSGEELDYDAPFSDEPTTTNLSIHQVSPTQSRASSIRSHSPPRPLSFQQEMTILTKPIQELDDLKRYLEERPFDRPRNRWIEEQTYFDNLTTRI